MNPFPAAILAAAISSSYVQADEPQQSVAPDKVRPWAEAEWRKTMTPSKPKPPPDAPAAEKASAESKEDGTLRLRAPMTSEWEAATTVIHANKDGTFTDGKAGGRLQWVSTVYATQPPEDGGKQLPELPGKFFNAALQPIPEDQLAAAGVPDSLVRRKPWGSGVPEWMCRVKLDGYADVSPGSASLFDTRTHCRLNFGAIYGPPVADGFIRGADAWCWHRAPVRIVTRFSHGPQEERVAAPTPGILEFSSGVRVQILAVADGRYTGTVDPWNTAAKEFTAIWKKDGSSDGKVTTLAWAVYPRTQLSEVVWHAVLDDGTQVPGSENAGTLTPCQFAAPLPRIKSIKAGMRQHHKRVLFELPFLPGLPAENDNVTDLLDVKIPWISLAALQSGPSSQQLAQFLQLTEGRDAVYFGFAGSFRDASLRTILGNSTKKWGIRWEIDGEGFTLSYPR